MSDGLRDRTCPECGHSSEHYSHCSKSPSVPRELSAGRVAEIDAWLNSMSGVPAKLPVLATPMSNALQACYDLRQQITALQSRESGWLIERQAGRNGPIYMRLIYYSDEAAKPIWVEDANAALRFSRKQDGEDVARLFQRECCLASVTEHVFCALTAAAPKPKI